MKGQSKRALCATITSADCKIESASATSVLRPTSTVVTTVAAPDHLLAHTSPVRREQIAYGDLPWDKAALPLAAMR